MEKWGERHKFIGWLVWGGAILSFGWMIPGFCLMALIGVESWRTPMLLIVGFYSVIGILVLLGFRFPEGDGG